MLQSIDKKMRTFYNVNTVERMGDFLEDLAWYEGCEMGDFWCHLNYLSQYSYCIIDEVFKKSIEVEIEEQFKHALDMIENADDYQLEVNDKFFETWEDE